MGKHLLHSISSSASKRLLVAGKQRWDWPPSPYNAVQTTASQQPSFPPRPLFTPSPITKNRCNPQAAVVGRRALLSAAFTAPQLQTKTKTEPKAVPTFWPSLLSGCGMWLVLLQKCSNDKITRSCPQCPSYTQRHSRFCRSSPHPFLALIHFYWPAPLAYHSEGPAARNKQLRKSQWLNFIKSWDLHSTQTALPCVNAIEMGGDRKERQRPCYRDSRHKPQCMGSPDNVENMVKIRWANRWAGWTNFFLKVTQRLNWWCELISSSAAWGKTLFMPRTAEVCAWDTNLVKKSLTINSSAQHITIIRFSKCPHRCWHFCMAVGEKRGHRMLWEPATVYWSRRGCWQQLF